MFINKIGMQHLEVGSNCQDYGFDTPELKLVCDGCSEGTHSEVGAKSYCHLAKLGYEPINIFDMLLKIFGQTIVSIKDFLCFTIMMVTEEENSFCVSYCGDGYIILEDFDGNISFEELNDGEYPKYFAYNYCPRSVLKYYTDGVDFSKKYFSKAEFKNIGIASDGLRFIVKCEKEDLKQEFIDLLKIGKESKVKRFINRNQSIFKDDITIAF